jgi:hypothetical protein
MPIDDYLFADIKEALGKKIGMSCLLPDDSNQKYSAATPDKVYASICKLLKVVL